MLCDVVINYNSMKPSNTPLHVAARNGDIETVKILLDKGANIDAKNQYGRTPLHAAIEKQLMCVTELLLMPRAGVNVGDNRVAVELRRLQIVEHLLNYGASVNCVCTSVWKKGYTPLHFAVEKGSEEVVTLLLSRGALVDVKGEDGVTPLHIAAEEGCISIVEGLLNHGACIHSLTLKERYTPLHIATKRGRETVVKLLLQRGSKVDIRDKDDKTVLHLAVETGNFKVTKDLLKYGYDVNILYNSTFKEGFTPLHAAAKNRKEEIAKLLIRYGADINAQDETKKTPIFYAIRNADLKIFNLLLTDGANIKDSPELLNIAVEKGCMEIVEALLQRDVDVKASDEYGRTALHYTATNDACYRFTNKYNYINIRGEIAKMLLIKGANVDAQTKNGVTPLHRSARRGSKEITLMLLNKGANVNAEQKDRTTPLHFATQEGHKEVVKVLLEYGAKVDSKIKNAITPLHLAAEKGYVEITETILIYGADINCRDKEGRTALHFASEGGHVEVVETLLENGADINITSRNNHTPIDEAVNSPNRKAYSYDYDDLNGPDHFDCPCEVVAEALKRHVVKMKTANLYVTEKNLQPLSWSYETNDFQEECEEEIENMKRETINNLNISFYDILAKGTSSLAVYMKNENIVQVLESGDYKTEFPIYASIIETHFRKGMQRKELLEQVNKNFHSLFHILPELPYDCTEQIFSYLSDKDLKNFSRSLAT